ncbi:hypothetical protein ACMC56_15635 [Campylobacterota bacterium DY0563]
MIIFLCLLNGYKAQETFIDIGIPEEYERAQSLQELMDLIH